MRSISCFPFLLAALGAAPAWAADHLLNVTATISTSCSFTEVPLHMGFPEIDPSGSETFTTSTTVQVRCTKGTRLNLRIGGEMHPPVLRHLSTIPFMGDTLVHMPYSLAWVTSAEPTGGFSTSAQDFVVTLTGTLTPAQYRDAAAGHYRDDLTLELTP